MGSVLLAPEENLSEQGSAQKWGYNLPTSLPMLGQALHFNALLQRKLQQKHGP